MARDNNHIKEIIEELKLREEKYLDKILGSMIGGAAGDALGYEVEFMDEDAIFYRFGNEGIREYQVDRVSGKALISDDTQMALFTATAIMLGHTRLCTRGIGGVPHHYCKFSYRDWLKTQQRRCKDEKEEYNYSWLLDVPELYARRAPGNTCLSSLSGEMVDVETNPPINNSKGCGAIMRIAPLALYYDDIAPDVLRREAVNISKITHGHPLGYLPSAVVMQIINQIVFGDSKLLKDIVNDALSGVLEQFKDEKYLGELEDIVNLAIKLSENKKSDLENIHQIGEGWVAEETLGIALYCALKYQNDFSKGIIAAVNHNGDSDSTGAVTGNILGALLGYNAIDDKWKNHLELWDVISEISIDLCHRNRMSEYGEYRDPYWMSKYMDNHRLPDKWLLQEYGRDREFTFSPKYDWLNNKMHRIYETFDIE